MSGQMPDEVWLDTYDAGPDNGPSKMQTDIYTPESVILPGSAVRYIRADLYEQAGEFDCQGIDPADLGQHFTDAMQALTTRNAVSKAACAQLIAEQAQRAEQVKTECERLRAAMNKILETDVDWTQGTGENMQRLYEIAFEALDHEWSIRMPRRGGAGGGGMSMLHPEELMTNYHELPEVPRCCATCAWCDQGWPICMHGNLDLHGRPVAPHGLCSHWERRDGSC